VVARESLERSKGEKVKGDGHQIRRIRSGEHRDYK